MYNNNIAKYEFVKILSLNYFTKFHKYNILIKQKLYKIMIIISHNIKYIYII